MNKSILYTMLATVIPFSASADIDFETTAGYTSVGIYDGWEQSPFRTNELSGNVMVVDNPDKSIDSALGEPINGSDKVLGAQRSRFGSNLFGVRVDLAEKFQLSPTWQYVHVMMHRPVTGRVALVGLGKRNDREDQTGEEEQFWYLSSTEIVADKWCDAVFAVKGSSDVEIHSLVVVPECESPHNRTEDFLFYIDDIAVNDDVKPRKSTEFYEINYNKTQDALSRTDRYLKSISLNSPAFGAQTATVPQQSDKMLYHYLPDQYFRAKAGETVSVSVDWTGSWMHAYVYLDRDNNGHFEAAVKSDGYTPEDGSDLMTFSCLANNDSYGYNSAGTYLYGSNRDTRTMPSFTIPADLKAGVYRMRYNIDWSSIDPGGNTASGNAITTNGGAITDIILIISDDSPITVRANQLNGDVTTASGEILTNYSATFGQPFTVKMVPAPGFDYSGMRVRHGYLSGDTLYHANPQYRDIIYGFEQFDSNDCLTLPAEIMDGDVLIEGYFVEDGARPQHVNVTYNLEYDGATIQTKTVQGTIGEPYPEVTWDCETSSSYYTVSGMPDGVVEEDNELIILTLTHNLPFNVSKDPDNAYWYNLALTADKNYLTHNAATSYISLATTTTSKPAASDHNSQWCFVGNAFSGFKIYNRGAGSGKILSSSQSITSSNDGTTYPILTDEPVPSTNNTYWIPVMSTYLTSDNGFYLHQLGHAAFNMNSRDSRLAYWIGGVDAGSTFTATFVDSTAAIDGIGIDTDNGPAEYYNLQGIKVNADNLTPGIYIRRQNGKAQKILIK